MSRILKGLRTFAASVEMTRAEYEDLPARPSGHVPSVFVVGDRWRIEGHVAVFACEKSDAPNAEGVALRVRRVRFVQAST